MLRRADATTSAEFIALQLISLPASLTFSISLSQAKLRDKLGKAVNRCTGMGIQPEFVTDIINQG
jgi:hypothetical protein